MLFSAVKGFNIPNLQYTAPNEGQLSIKSSELSVGDRTKSTK